MSQRHERLAELIVDFGANVQPGQIVDLSADLGKEELARAVAARAYERGPKFVDVSYYDPYEKTWLQLAWFDGPKPVIVTLGDLSAKDGPLRAQIDKLTWGRKMRETRMTPQ